MRFMFCTLLVILGVVCRVAPHPWNFVPVGAIALFAGATFDDRRSAFLVPLTAMFLGDLLLGFHSLMPVIYATYALIVALGIRLRARRHSVIAVGGAAIASATIFFVITNFAVWASGGLYPMTFEGLVECYVAAIPFFERTIASDLLFSAIFFGAFALAERRFAAFAPIGRR